MRRKIVRINEDRCDGCGLCVPSCAEGAIRILDGKARLIGDMYCDGLGACLGQCPKDAIIIEEREAAAFDEEEVKKHLKSAKPATGHAHPRSPSGCPGSASQVFSPEGKASGPCADQPDSPSSLSHWPIQLALVAPSASFLKNADLIVCADCVPFTVPDFHQRYLSGKAVLVGCPKLDNMEAYREKLGKIFIEAAPRRITVLRMEVPCCGALAAIIRVALAQTASTIPFEIHTIGIKGGISIQKITLD